jgi:hypothetical protein
MVAPVVALLFTVPVFMDEAAAQRPGDRDRGYDRGAPGADRDRREEWELLGSTRIGGIGIDRDVIDVGRREGRFEKLSLQAREGSVFLLEVLVVYANDEVQRFDVRQHLGEGERTRPIDLEGRGRAIKRIEVAARAGRGFRRRAFLDVFGEKGRARDEWELLGQQTVGFGVDRDVIRVGRREGRFEKILLAVKDNDVEILDLKVFFNRGTPQDVRVREFIRAGARTRPLDLQGGDRLIDRIELVYRSRPGFRGRAVVEVYGLKGGGDRDHARWEELGCQKVGFGADRDVIRVGRSEGRFSAIRLRVDRSDVLLLSLKVVYEHGPPDDFEVGTRIRAGEETRPLDLRGERRAIRQIELVYSSIPSFKGSPTLCADGRQ